MKSEPTSFSIDDLKRVKKTPWDGVRNYQARNFITSMQKGDRVLFYHSNTEPIGVFGTMRICSEPYEDKTQFDKKNHHYDPKAKREHPRWYLVDVCFEKKFREPISLAEIKAHPKLFEMLVARQGRRLSVQPVSYEHFNIVEKLGGKKYRPRINAGA